MEKIRLGRTNLMVSRIGFGGIPIQRCAEDEAIGVVQRCLDHGITYIDTANSYTTSEFRIGKAVAQRNRKDLVIATKSGARTRESVEAHLANSLKMLGTDYIDLYQFHGVNDSNNLDMVLDSKGPLRVIEKAMKNGVIKHFGISSHNSDVAKEAVKTDKFETLMFPFNFITSEPLDDLIPLCRSHDIAFIAMKPLAGGMLDNATLAFKYLLQYPDIIPLVGIEKISEIDEIAGLLGKSWNLTAAEKHQLAKMKKMGNKFCRRCDYCQPCSAGIPISNVMNYPSFIKRMPAERIFSTVMEPVMKAVYDCQDCGECEARCPFKLPIRTIMKDYQAQYNTAKENWQKSKM